MGLIGVIIMLIAVAIGIIWFGFILERIKYKTFQK